MPLTALCAEIQNTDVVWNNLDTSSISVDLEGLDLLSYKKDDSILNPSIITLAEQGFSSNTDYEKCALYLFAYVPMADELNLRSALNKVQLKNGDNFSKYNLTYVSDNGEAIVKYKIDLPRSFFEQQSTKSRVYEISAVEFAEKSTSTVKDYKIGGKYIFEGLDESAALKKVETFEVVRLDINYTTFRNTSSLGEDYRNQLTSVYFSIPNYLLERYDNNLYGIDCTYEKYYTKPMVVTKSDAVYNSLSELNSNSLLAYTDNNSLSAYYYNPDINLSLVSYTSNLGVNISIETYKFAFNKNFASGYTNYIFIGDFQNPTYIPLYFRSYEDFDGDFWISKDEVQGKINSIFPTLEKDSHYLKSGLDYYHRHLFEDYYLEQDGTKVFVGVKADDYATSGKISGKIEKAITFDDNPYNMVSYGSSASFWDKLDNYGLKYFIVGLRNDENYVAKPIEVIKSVDYKTLSDEAFSNKYLIDENEISEVKANVTLNEAKDETTYIFRVDVAPYRAFDLTPAGTSFVCQMPVYMGFDVLDLMFKDKNGDIVKVAVSSDPENLVGGVEPPLSDVLEHDYEDWYNSLIKDIKKFVMLILGIIALIVFVYVYLKLSGFISSTAGNSIKTLTSSKPKFKRRK